MIPTEICFFKILVFRVALGSKARLRGRYRDFPYMHVKDNLCFCFNETSRIRHFYLLVNLKGSKKIKKCHVEQEKGN